MRITGSITIGKSTDKILLDDLNFEQIFRGKRVALAAQFL